MKQKVINWLRSGCNFNEGIALLPATGIWFNLARTCSLQGPTKLNVSMLEYQLCKMVGISEKEISSFKKPAKSAKPSNPVVVAKPAKSANLPDIKTEKPVPVKEPIVKKEPEIVLKSPETVIKPTKNVIKEPEIVISEETKQTSKLRDEFPFLNHKNCPEELKILVSDKITAHHNYCEAHSQLMGCTTDTDLFLTASDVVENYLENQQIYDELNHYKKTGKLLMKHPIFKRRKEEEKIGKMKINELIKLKDRLSMNIWRNEKKIKDDPDSECTFDRKQSVKEYRYQLKLVNNILRINE